MSFWKDVRDLRDATKANVDAGRGNRSLIEAVEQMKDHPAPRPTPQPKRRHLRTFLISGLFGAIWQGTRR
jgi:hypothetical protein